MVFKLVSSSGDAIHTPSQFPALGLNESKKVRGHKLTRGVGEVKMCVDSTTHFLIFKRQYKMRIESHVQSYECQDLAV